MTDPTASGPNPSAASVIAQAEAIIAQGDTDADPLLVAYAAIEILPSVVAEYAHLTAQLAEWAEKDGNSPGYNAEKARTYGRIAAEEREARKAAEAQLAAATARAGEAEIVAHAQAEALSEAADAIESAADAIEGLDGGDIDGECRMNRKFAKKIRALSAASTTSNVVAVAALVAIVELDTIACGPHAPCEGPVERAIVALLPLVPMGADEELSAKERLAALRAGGGR